MNGGGHDGAGQEDDGLLKVFGLGYPERRADPLDILLVWSKLHINELCCLGEVKRGWYLRQSPD